jgi:hypothetical protein
MSGKPYPEGVTEVLAALERSSALQDRIAELSPLVAELSAAKAENEALASKVADLLGKMDLESQGNYGFGGRMGWFVAEMRRQLLSDRVAQTQAVGGYTHMERLSGATMEQLRKWHEYGKTMAEPFEADPPMTNPLRLALYEVAEKMLATGGSITAQPQAQEGKKE